MKAGAKHSAATRLKMSESHWTKKRGAKKIRAIITRKTAAALTGRLRGPMPEKTKLLLRLAKLSPATKSYAALHRRVRAQRGRPNHCEMCGRCDDGVKYQWANLTGAYENLMDYSRLCVPCHAKIDRRESHMVCARCGSRKRKRIYGRKILLRPFTLIPAGCSPLD